MGLDRRRPGKRQLIGQKALRHFFAALDGVVPQDGLSRAVLGAIGGVDKLREGWMRGLGRNGWPRSPRWSSNRPMRAIRRPGEYASARSSISRR